MIAPVEPTPGEQSYLEMMRALTKKARKNLEKVERIEKLTYLLMNLGCATFVTAMLLTLWICGRILVAVGGSLW